jgi:phosphopantothenoylcysteine synthetase/decarboxylase
MNLFVTAGNTQVAIDQVRCLTNIFTGRTGAAIALHADRRGHTVCLATSTLNSVLDMVPDYGEPQAERFSCVAYRTFEDLQKLMAERIPGGGFDAVIHCAAVSDYLSGGVYSPAPGTRFDSESATWHSATAPHLIDRAAGKVKSDEPELWLRLVRAPKLVDCIRSDWGFHGVLVKFKLEVGVEEEQLRAIAERSRRHSGADLMVANTLEGAATWALLGPVAPTPPSPSPVRGGECDSPPFEGEAGGGCYDKVSRRDLPGRLLDAVEALHREKCHGFGASRGDRLCGSDPHAAAL